MTFLSTFTLPDEDAEWDFFIKQKSRAYSTYYPFQIFPQKQVPTLTFEPITIFYGDNGSGKSTLLNVIAEKLGLARGTLYNRSSFEADYLTLCNFELAAPIPDGSAIISSDEVFDAMLNTRALNQQIDRRRDDMFDDYLDNKFASFHYHDLSDYDELKKRSWKPAARPNPVTYATIWPKTPANFPTAKARCSFSRTSCRTSGSTCWTNRRTRCRRPTSRNWPPT